MTLFKHRSPLPSLDGIMWKLYSNILLCGEAHPTVMDFRSLYSFLSKKSIHAKNTRVRVCNHRFEAKVNLEAFSIPSPFRSVKPPCSREVANVWVLVLLPSSPLVVWLAREMLMPRSTQLLQKDSVVSSQTPWSAPACFHFVCVPCWRVCTCVLFGANNWTG